MLCYRNFFIAFELNYSIFNSNESKHFKIVLYELLLQNILFKLNLIGLYLCSKVYKGNKSQHISNINAENFSF